MRTSKITPNTADIRRVAIDPGTYDELVEAVAHCQTVLIGESTHGTDEFYCERAAITKRLIEEHGFRTIAIEGDWPDTYRIHQYITGAAGELTALDALAGFRRFPSWMWRNTAMLDVVGWLYDFNAHREHNDRCGIYGLDLYSMHASAALVVNYLERAAPDAAERARARYECINGSGIEPQQYAHEVMLGLRADCEQDILDQLLEITQRRNYFVTQDLLPPTTPTDAWMDAHQNAIVVRNAERYYRTMFRGDVESWNTRDRHMSETLARLQLFAAQHTTSPKTVVWAHNSHVGDARATSMGRRGQISLGQLVRQQHGHECALIGLTSFHGSVTAADGWDGDPRHMVMRPAMESSLEHALHHAGMERALILPNALQDIPAFRVPLLQRAIGVVYRTATERTSHYLEAVPARQFDALLHIDTTRAVEPLEHTAPHEVNELVETWPFGT